MPEARIEATFHGEKAEKRYKYMLLEYLGLGYFWKNETQFEVRQTQNKI